MDYIFAVSVGDQEICKIRNFHTYGNIYLQCDHLGWPCHSGHTTFTSSQRRSSYARNDLAGKRVFSADGGMPPSRLPNLWLKERKLRQLRISK